MNQAKSETWPVEKLYNWDKNPRGIRDEDFERLKHQITKHGVYKPLIVTPMGEVIGGNMRLRALKALGAKEVWVSVVEPKSEQEKIEIALSDNDRAGYYELDELAELVIDLDIDKDAYKVDIGAPRTLADVLSQYGPDPDEDDPPEVDDENPPASKEGEIYQLGEHRLMCGDTTNLNHVKTLMDGVGGDMSFTDPPYNVDYSGAGANTSRKIANDKMTPEEFELWLTEAMKSYRIALKDTAPLYVCYASSSHREFENALNAVGYLVKNQIIWVKNNASMGWGHYRWKHEPILYAGVAGETTKFFGDRKNYTEWQTVPEGQELTDLLQNFIETQEKGGSTVWRIKREAAQSYEHPTTKPVRLVAIALRNSSKRGDVIVDLFAGSGSLMSACEQMERKAYMMELDPKFCDVIRKRYANLIDQGEKWQELTPPLLTKN